MAAFTGFGRLQGFHIGILRAGTLFLELGRYSQDNNGIQRAGTVF